MELRVHAMQWNIDRNLLFVWSLGSPFIFPRSPMVEWAIAGFWHRELCVLKIAAARRPASKGQAAFLSRVQGKMETVSPPTHKLDLEVS